MNCYLSEADSPPGPHLGLPKRVGGGGEGTRPFFEVSSRRSSNRTFLRRDIDNLWDQLSVSQGQCRG